MTGIRPLTRAALAAALVLVPVTAAFSADAVAPFADVDNDGVFGPNDVAITDFLADGRFNTSEAEGRWTPPAGKVGIVVPAGARRFAPKGGVLLLAASGDVTVNADLSNPVRDGAILLVANGAVHVAPGVKISGGDFVKLVAEGDVTIGDGATLATKGRDFEDRLSIVSRLGNITVGQKVTLSGGGLCQVATADDTGGQITIGPKSKVNGSGNLQVTSGLDLTLDGSSISAPSILLGSHASVHSPGHAMIRGASIKAGGEDGRVHIYADGGEGSMVDLTGTKMKVSDQANVLITADMVLN
jgi:hypothetical protein